MVWLYTGFLTGIFECGAVLEFALAVTTLRRADWNGAVAFGIGFGAFETVATPSESPLMILLSAALPQVPSELPVEYRSLTAAVGFADAALPALERLNAVFIHTFSGALIIHGVQDRRWKWCWSSFAYKTLVDAIPAERLAKHSLWLMGLPSLLFGIVGLLGLQVLRNGWGIRDAHAIIDSSKPN